MPLLFDRLDKLPLYLRLAQSCNIHGMRQSARSDGILVYLAHRC
jgi:hypothetical protein